MAARRAAGRAAWRGLASEMQDEFVQEGAHSRTKRIGFAVPPSAWSPSNPALNPNKPLELVSLCLSFNLTLRQPKLVEQCAVEHSWGEKVGVGMLVVDLPCVTRRSLDGFT